MLNIDSDAYQDNLYIDAIVLRIEDMIKSPEISSDSLELLLKAVVSALRADKHLLNNFKSSSFIEGDFFDADEADTTRVGSRQPSVTRVSRTLNNGRTYSITGPFFKKRNT